MLDGLTMLHRSKTGLASKRTWESAVVCVCRSCRVLPCGLLLNATQLQPPSREHHSHPATEPTEPPNTTPRNSTRGNPAEPRSAMTRHSARRVREWADGRSMSKRVPMPVEQGMSMEHRAGASSDQIKRKSRGLTSSQVHSERLTVHRLWGGSLSPHRQEPRSLVRRWAHPPIACGSKKSLVALLRQTVKVRRLETGYPGCGKGMHHAPPASPASPPRQETGHGCKRARVCRGGVGGCFRFFTPLPGI